MSGRAGRRGKDKSGTVIMMVDESLSEEAGREILRGKPAPLNSAFHITYNMLLNLLRVEEINPEYLMERSFCQFQNYSCLPELCEGLCPRLYSMNLFANFKFILIFFFAERNKLKTELDSIVLEDESSVMSYRNCQQSLEDTLRRQWRYIRRPEHIVSFLQPGRLVKVSLFNHLTKQSY